MTMKLLQPAGLLAAVLLPAILFFYLQKKQAATYQVPWLDLWEEALREAKGAGRRKIPPSLLLAIQLLAAILMILALSQPIWQEALKGQQVVLALDCSISMKAKIHGRDRFTEARKQASDYVQTLPDSARIMLVLLQEDSRIHLQDGTRDEALKALQEISCTNEALDIGKARALLSSVSGSRILFSDKVLKFGIKQVQVGGELENVGIRGATFDYYSGTLLCRVKNDGTGSRKITVEGQDDQGHRDLQSLTIEGGKEADLSFKMPGQPGLAAARILQEDMLAEDNTYIVPIGNAYKPRILLVGSSPFLREALASLPGIRLETADGLEALKDPYDLYIIAQKVQASLLPREGNVWNLFPPTEMVGGYLKSPEPLEEGNPGPEVDWSMNLAEAYTGETAYLKAREGYRSILLADRKPVMIYGMEAGRKMIDSTLDLNQTNLVLLPDFPILVHTAVDWLTRDTVKGLPVNPPPAFTTGGEATPIQAETQAQNQGPFLIRYLSPALIAGVLVLMLLEMEVYRHGL